MLPHTSLPEEHWEVQEPWEVHEPQRPTSWTDPVACSALCHLLLDDRGIHATALPTTGPAEDNNENLESDDPIQQRCSRHKVTSRSSHLVCEKRRAALPAALYVEHVAPFLRFGGPLPNMLYVFGGRVPLAGFQTLRPSRDIVHNSVEMFDTWHGRWVKCPPMPCHRAGAAAAPLQDGRILVCGGYDERGVVDGLLSACDAFNPWEERWEAGVAHLLRGRWGHSCAVQGGRVFAVGGCSVWQPGTQASAFMETLNSCEVFIEKSGESRWQRCGSLQVPRSGARVVPLGEKYLLAVGGCMDPFGRVQMQASVELYDVEAGCWSLLGVHLANPRTCAVVAAFDEHHVVAIGGATSEQPPGAPSASAEIVTVPLPGRKHSDVNCVTQDLNEDFSETRNVLDIGDDVSALEMLEKQFVPDHLIGRVGCQGTVMHLPSDRTRYPLSNQRCLVAIGGERCDRKPEHEMFTRILNLETGTWCSDDLLPPLQTPPRTAVALCVGIGRVDGARLQA